jgi:hypothetical protein
MSSPELYCPACYGAVEAGATRCPSAECGIALARCRNPACTGLLGPDDRFCADCQLEAELPAPPAPPPAPPAPSRPAAPAVLPQRADAAVPPAAAPASSPLDLTTLFAAFKSLGAPAPVPAAAGAPGPTLPAVVTAPAPLAAPAASFAPPVAASAVHLQAEYQTPPVMKKGRQAYLGLRVLASARDAIELRAEFQSGLFAADPTSALVAPGSITALPPARFVPAVSGSDNARVTLTARTTHGVPVGRWNADIVLTVADDAPQPFQISNTGGGDVVLYGAPPVAAPNYLEGTQAVWRMLSLPPDAGFQQRIARLRKPAAIPAPPGAPAPPGQALVVVEDRTTGVRAAVAVVRGPAATAGRGGKPDTAWWVQGEPLNRTAHLNISGLHALLNLRDEHAWVTDCSRFGTRLNGAALAPKEATTLADGDELDLASGGFRVRVGLASDAAGVGAVWLLRTDAHAGRLSYLLASRPTPAPVFVPCAAAPVGWLAWTAGQGGLASLQFRPAEGGAWTIVPPDQSVLVSGRFRVGWRAVPAPRGQEHDLNPNPPILP